MNGKKSIFKIYVCIGGKDTFRLVLCYLYDNPIIEGRLIAVHHPLDMEGNPVDGWNASDYQTGRVISHQAGTRDAAIKIAIAQLEVSVCLRGIDGTLDIIKEHKVINEIPKAVK